VFRLDFSLVNNQFQIQLIFPVSNREELSDPKAEVRYGLGCTVFVELDNRKPGNPDIRIHYACGKFDVLGTFGRAMIRQDALAILSEPRIMHEIREVLAKPSDPEFTDKSATGWPKT